MFGSLIKFFWPGFTDIEVKKYGLLSIAFGSLIGTYWTLRGMKDTLFFHYVGTLYQPRAKIVSLFVVALCLFIYAKLVDRFEKHQLFYILGSFYLILFGALAVSLLLGDLSVSFFAADYVRKVLSWATYFAVESYGSLMIPMFWSFVVSITETEIGKKTFPLVIVGGQIGGILFPIISVIIQSPTGQRIVPIFSTYGTSIVYLIMTAISSSLLFVVSYFMLVMPPLELQSSAPQQIKKKKPGFFEGIRLILHHPYLLGVLIVSTFYELVLTIVDLDMKGNAKIVYATRESFGAFNSRFGITVNTVTFVLALLGTRRFIDKFGLRVSILAFPSILVVAMGIRFYIGMFFNPTTEVLLWTAFAVMVLGRCLTYSLNNPSKELMYIPTSKDVKYKAKGWIDAFGARGSKTSASLVSQQLISMAPAHMSSLTLLLSYGSIFGFGVIAIWWVAAFYVGKKYNDLTENNEIIE